MNKKAIAEVLSKAPLCSGHIIAQRGMATEYCAMGALAKACGASDDELAVTNITGVDLFFNYERQLKDKFGIETYIQFSSLMNVNDNVASPITRSKEVLKQAVGLDDSEIAEILGTKVNV